jgi:lysozyme
MMQYSRNGLALTESFEQCRLTPYRDEGGVWTNGWGNTHGVVPGVEITQQKADADLLANVQDAINCVNRVVTVTLSQNEFDALVDLTFNIGVGSFAGSTLLKKLNRQDYLGASKEILRWDLVKGKESAGLFRRRHEDQRLFDSL